MRCFFGSKESDLKAVSRRFISPFFSEMCLSVWLALLICQLGYAQPSSKWMERIALKEGLPSNGSLDVIQDHRGYIWLATYNGVVRYDGYDFEVFRKGLSHESILPPVGRSFTSLLEARNGWIWMSTLGEGFCAFDPFREQFINFPNESPDGRSINHAHRVFMEDSEGRVWLAEQDETDQVHFKYIHPDCPVPVAFSQGFKFDARPIYGGVLLEAQDGSIWMHRSDEGVFRWKSGQAEFERVLDGSGEFLLSGYTINYLHPADGGIWIGTDSGLKWYDPYRASLGQLPPKLESEPAIQSGAITFVEQDSVGNLWIGSETAGIFKYSPTSDLVSHFPVFQDHPSHPSIIVRPIASNREEIWFVSDTREFQVFPREFWCYRFSTGKLIAYGSDFNRTSNETVTAFSDFMVDRSGGIWVADILGTQREHQLPGRLDIWTVGMSGRVDLQTDSVIQVQADSAGNVWVMGHEAIFVFDDTLSSFRRYSPKVNRTLVFHTFLEDSKGNLWIGSNLGLWRYLPQSNEWSLEISAGSGQSGVDPLFVDDKGWMWYQHTMASYGRNFGISLGAISTQSLAIVVGQNSPTAQSLDGQFFTDGLKDSQGRLWISTLSGLFLLNKDQKQFLPFPSQSLSSCELTSELVHFLFEDKQGGLFAATYDEGLNRWDQGESCFTNWREVYGMEIVMCALEDEKGMKWLGTNRGEGLFKMGAEGEILGIYGPENGLAGHEVSVMAIDSAGGLWIPSVNGIARFDPQKEHATIYGEAYGIAAYTPDTHNEQYRNMLVDSQGNIWYNTYDQVVRIIPRQIQQEDSVAPATLIEAIRLGNQWLSSPDSQFLDTHISLQKDLELPYNYRNISFRFIGLHFGHSENNLYRFRMSGMEEEWSEPSSIRHARYAGIPPGNYSFQVQSCNADGFWDQAGTAIRIRILPPWWMTYWAYGGYSLIALLCILLGFYWFSKEQTAKLIRQAQELEDERRRTEQLRELDQLKDQFLANTSHELRTPLNGIIGLSEGIYERSDKPADMNDLALVISSGKRLHHLVDELLDFSKLKQGELTISQASVDLTCEVELAFQMSKPLVRDKAIDMHMHFPEDFPAVWSDPLRLQQILINLIGNAVKFTEQGSISVTGSVSGDWVKVQVVDTGIGISSDKQGRIFEAFKQADGSTVRKYGGTGLGLSITRQLVELHGGQIGVESQLGAGSTFWFTLPVSRSTDPVVNVMDLEKDRVIPLPEIDTPLDQVETIEMAGSSGSDRDSSNLFRILIVDDEPVNLHVMKSHLSMGGFELVFAEDGQAALDLLESTHSFDLVLLDVMMPNMSGYEVCRRIRMQHLPSELPIIMVTAKNQVNDLVTGLSKGANDYLAKPFSKKELLARIKTHLELNQIFHIADRFIPNEFIRSLGHERLTDVKLGDAVAREVSVMFSDIRSYTSLAESMTPEDVFAFVMGYTARMGPVIQRNQGFVNQYLGDGIMAIFQDQVDDALAAMVEMQEVLRAYNLERASKDRVPIAVGMGLHSGPLIMGIIGDKTRSDAATISDTVNTAARMEGLTKVFGANILISGESYRNMRNPEFYTFRYLGKTSVKGKQSLVELYECVDGDPSLVREKKQQTHHEFAKAIACFYTRQYPGAIRLLTELIEENPEDRVAQYFLKRAQTHVAQVIS
ncbi:ATP-binding protein [Pontibacter sp. G13]|uniref:ATP-binding protein n=1 Tax=Pontibacter sp. G13 TaxID=3074898 RepID=UPI00288C4360|nr:ATP-binding protein [Pontibacter sp. G13]WNJ16388.1 ATP-binding protein [Pontibacter sp. G13]